MLINSFQPAFPQKGAEPIGDVDVVPSKDLSQNGGHISHRVSMSDREFYSRGSSSLEEDECQFTILQSTSLRRDV